MKASQKMKSGLGIIYSRLTGRKFPLAVGWELTYLCNSNCSYCTTNDIKTKELNTIQIFKIIDELKEMGCQLITYTGGECTLHPDFEEIVRYTYKKNIDCCIVTNGRLVPQKIDTFIKYVDNVQITLDGRKSVQENQRYKGSYDAAIDALELLTKNDKIRLNINMVFTKNNTSIEDLKHVLEITKKYNARLSVCPLTKLLSQMRGKNKWEKFMKDNAPSREKQLKILEYLIKEKKSGNTNVGQSLTVLRHLKQWPKHERIRCVAGILYARISPNGQLYSCNKFFSNKYLTSSNAANVGFKKAWESLKPENCNSCWFNSRLDFNFTYNLDPRAIMQQLFK